MAKGNTIVCGILSNKGYSTSKIAEIIDAHDQTVRTQVKKWKSLPEEEREKLVSIMMEPKKNLPPEKAPIEKPDTEAQIPSTTVPPSEEEIEKATKLNQMFQEKVLRLARDGKISWSLHDDIIGALRFLEANRASINETYDSIIKIVDANPAIKRSIERRSNN